MALVGLWLVVSLVRVCLISVLCLCLVWVWKLCRMRRLLWVCR